MVEVGRVGDWSVWMEPCRRPGCRCRNVGLCAVPVGLVLDASSGDLVTSLRLDLELGVADALEGPAAEGLLAAVTTGERLDALFDLWVVARSAPERLARKAPHKRHPADLVAWPDIFPNDRVDAFAIGDGHYRAIEQFCVNPGCSCSEVVVSFCDPSGGEVATVRVDTRTGKIVDSRGDAACWTAYVARHPEWAPRLVRRKAEMQAPSLRPTRRAAAHRRLRPARRRRLTRPDRA